VRARGELDVNQPHRRPIRHLAVVLALALVASACSAVRGPTRTLSFEGPEDGELVNAESIADLRFVASAEAQQTDEVSIDDLVVLLDGEDVTADADRAADRLVYAPGELPDGQRTVTFGSLGELDEDGQPAEDAEVEHLHEWTVEVDTTPPDLELTSPDGAVVAGEPLTVAGSTEPGATVEVAGESTTAGEDGDFEVELASAPEGDLELVAIDAAGNRTTEGVSLVAVPSRAEVDEVRAVHVSFCGWATPSLKEPVLQKIEDGLINAVQLDLKDETGKVGHDTDVEMAALVGADQPDCRVDLPAAVEELHALGVPVIGRIVAFADPVLARWAWDNGERDWVTQTAGGEMFVGKYAGFSNFAHPEIVEYTVDLAEEAAAMGVDHILWDYIRKPDGPVEQFRFVGLETTAEEAIVDFTRQADERLAPYGVQHGASVYGVSADRPTEVSQDIVALSDHLDYVAPMIYPSHWGPGEYDVADPLMQPYDMVAATLEVWLDVTEGKRARVMPWLEDSNWPIRLGFPDRARYIREQIQATYDAGIDEWMLWDSSVKYTTSGMIQPGG
jgi:hypothetical protein